MSLLHLIWIIPTLWMSGYITGAVLARNKMVDQNIPNKEKDV